MSLHIPKRVAAIHDISGFGRCSLGVVIPILSCMGAQVCSAPTAVLSTHTGGFEGFTFTDMTPSLPSYFAHWRSLDIAFDCVYSGFLGSQQQIDIIINFIDTTNCPMVVIDPVFADDGKLYSTLDASFIEHMRRLIAHANVITPNMTEAAFLLDEPLSDALSPSIAKDWLMRLGGMISPHGAVALTGLRLADGIYGVGIYNQTNGKFWVANCDYIPVMYPGTGDIFASVMIGAMLGGLNPPQAAAKACAFVQTAIRATYGNGQPTREGVSLEAVLHTLNDTSCSGFYEI